MLGAADPQLHTPEPVAHAEIEKATKRSRNLTTSDAFKIRKLNRACQKPRLNQGVRGSPRQARKQHSSAWRNRPGSIGGQSPEAGETANAGEPWLACHCAIEGQEPPLRDRSGDFSLRANHDADMPVPASRSAILGLGRGRLRQHQPESAIHKPSPAGGDLNPWRSR